MEPAEIPLAKRPRYKLILGKWPVAKITKQLDMYKVDLQIEGRVMFSFIMGGDPDIREGDLLTLYTEVLINDKPSPTSVQ
jgi:hypothetical protein